MSRGRSRLPDRTEDGREVRLEKVPGGLRLAAWHGGQLVKDAPVLALLDLPDMLSSAAEQGLLSQPEADWSGKPAVGLHGASPGRSGELRDELRVERLDDHQVRIARWIMRPEPRLGAAGDARAAAGGALRRCARSRRGEGRPVRRSGGLATIYVCRSSS